MSDEEHIVDNILYLSSYRQEKESVLQEDEDAEDIKINSGRMTFDAIIGVAVLSISMIGFTVIIASLVLY
ncbi:MAG: hypothetical protein ACW96N_00030 [Candidatus Thorarchaeota archaeon]|jgi:hypothetical protein